MADDIKKEEETPTSASEGETTQEAGEEELGETKETKPEPETTDYKAEFEKEKEKREELEGRIGKADRRIVKLKNKMDEAGVEEEETGGMSEDTVKEAVKSAVQEVVKPLEERLDKTEGQLSETLRASASKATVSPGGGEGGQKAPIVAKPPKLSPQDQNLVSTYELRWDATKVNPETNEKGVYVDKNGMVFPMNYRRDGDVRIGRPLR